jgi:hypothetical protein
MIIGGKRKRINKKDHEAILKKVKEMKAKEAKRKKA